MLSKMDDYPIHQTSEPVAHPASSDRHVYDRYWFNGYQDDGAVYFGIAAAAGVVVNDNLVLVDYIGRLRSSGATVLEAIENAGVHRFRPILLTTLTTFIGLLPIMAERSIDAQFLKPAVLALAFGVLFALFVTLFMVPSLYAIGEDIRVTLGALRRRLQEARQAGNHST